MATTFQQPLPDMEETFSSNQEKNSSKTTFRPTIDQPKIKEINRQQMLMRIVEIENLIPEDHEARAIWEFVGKLDLSGFYQDIRTIEGSAGRSCLSPQLLVSIWVYAYCRGVGYAREVGRLIECDPAFQWLTGMTLINYHTLSDFRVDHQEALNQMLIEVLGVLSAEGLITLQRVAQDGTKIKANARSGSFRREQRIQEHLAEAKQQVEALNESLVPEEFSARKMRTAQERVKKLELALQELEKVRALKKTAKEKEQARVSETDPEARIMKQSDGGFAPSYNVQISTDSQSGIIVGVEVTQAGNDTHELVPGVKKVEENCGRKPDQVLVDGGFTNKESIQEMADRKIDLIGSLSHPDFSSRAKGKGIDPEFTVKAFHYDQKTDTYACPAGQKLIFQWKTKEKGQDVNRYHPTTNVCQSCPFKKKCCPTEPKAGRSISRTVDSPAVAAFKKKMETEEAKKIYKQRGPLAEFSNLWIKSKLKLRQFVLQGLPKVNMEAIWACLATNIQKWIAQKWKPLWVTR